MRSLKTCSEIGSVVNVHVYVVGLREILFFDHQVLNICFNTLRSGQILTPVPDNRFKDIFENKIDRIPLTHCGLVTSYGDSDLGQY